MIEGLGGKIYLDYAATTPLDKDLSLHMQDVWKNNWGNASSPHFFGLRARAIIDEARARAARALGVRSQEIIFTGSATEANNLAIQGAVRHALESKENRKANIVISSVEHKSVIAPAEQLRSAFNIEVRYAPVDENGIVSLDTLQKIIDENTVLVSVMWANNEMGAVQPIKDIAGMVKSHKKESSYPLFHVDAAQAFQYVDVSKDISSIDLLTLSGHKIYGPQGVGFLYRKEGIAIKAIIAGGEQEYGVRAGTENVALISACSLALEQAVTMRGQETKRIEDMGAYFTKKLFDLIPDAQILGHTIRRVPHIYLVVFSENVLADELLYLLGEVGVAISTGSACTTGKIEKSHVLAAMGVSQSHANSAVRISLGRGTTREEIDVCVAALCAAHKKLVA